jgi:hypothetical protein
MQPEKLTAFSRQSALQHWFKRKKLACNYDVGIRPERMPSLLACRYEIVFKAISTCNIGLMGKKLSCTDDILRVRNQKILACTSDITSQFGPASF